MSASGTLLIVDDEPSIRKSLERLLRPEGYRIYSAESADAANTILDSDAVDVILCDQDMPGKNGTEFLREVANRFPNQRRLMISGRFQSDDVALAMDSGAIHKFMMKPWDDAILKADIRASFRQVIADLTRKPADGDSRNAEPLDWGTFQEERQLTRELHAAATNGSLHLQYQPQVDLRTGEVCGLEALLRWTASIGPVRPDRFIAIAERTGAMQKLTQWVLCEALHHAGLWQTQWQGHVSLNVSPSDLTGLDLVPKLRTLLDANEVDPALIHIEVTESQIVDPNLEVTKALQDLSDLGVGISVDDFGAGATSLSYLADLPFSSLKLDRSLTMNLDNEKGIEVVRKILEMARCLGMTTVVEGLETESQVERARDLGADIAQGYFFSKPIGHQSIADWIAAGVQGIPE